MRLPTLSPPNRELLGHFARREIRSRYKGSLLGLGWTLIIPVVLMLTYTFVFSKLLPVGGHLKNYWLYLLVGIAFWSLFGSCWVSGATSLIANKGLITKVPFPRALLPIASLTSQVVTMLVMFGIMVPASILLTPGHGKFLVLVPLVLLATGMMAAGIALAMSVINVYFRDAEHIVAALLIPWFFVTPIIYEMSSIGMLQGNTLAWRVLKYGNPATPFVMSLQDLIYFGRMPGWQLWVYIYAAGVAVLAVGWWVFRRGERDLAVEM